MECSTPNCDKQDTHPIAYPRVPYCSKHWNELIVYYEGEREKARFMNKSVTLSDQVAKLERDVILYKNKLAEIELNNQWLRHSLLDLKRAYASLPTEDTMETGG